jgi:hypothetical protein
VSTYFDNFFFAEWREKGQEEFVLHEEDDPSFDIGTFQLMIHAALSLAWMVQELLELFKGIQWFIKQITSGFPIFKKEHE